MRPTGIPNPALPEGGSTGTRNSNTTSATPVPTVQLLIRSSCSGGSTSLPNCVTGLGTAGAAEALAKELLSVHADPQRLTRAILTASSSYSNINNVQVRKIITTCCRRFSGLLENLFLYSASWTINIRTHNVRHFNVSNTHTSLVRFFSKCKQ